MPRKICEKKCDKETCCDKIRELYFLIENLSQFPTQRPYAQFRMRTTDTVLSSPGNIPVVRLMEFIPTPTTPPPSVPPAEYYNVQNPNNTIIIDNALYGTTTVTNAEILIKNPGIYQISFHIKFFMQSPNTLFIIHVRQVNKTSGPPSFFPFTFGDDNPELGIYGVPIVNPVLSGAPFVYSGNVTGLISVDKVDNVGRTGNNRINLQLQSNILPTPSQTVQPTTFDPGNPGFIALDSNFIYITQIAPLP